MVEIMVEIPHDLLPLRNVVFDISTAHHLTN